MKLNKIAILSLFIMLVCFIGAASATEDVNDNMTVDSSSIDDVDTSVGEVVSVESNDDQDSDGSLNEQSSSSCSGTPVNAASWSTLRVYAQSSTNYAITLTGNSYTIGSDINFGNNVCIIGTSNSYITGGSTSATPFKNTNSALTLHFINVKFLNVNAKNLLELDGTVYLDNCTFDNVQTATGHNSVIYNTNNLMYLTGCNITNCHTGYGAVSNYNSGSTTSPVMYVDDCRFINNSASVEPGAINNCGILYVNNSEFDGNHANWWAGAIHTHTNAQTEIENTQFRRNTAGWNGGALFTYSKLKIKNCTFEDNNCTTNNGGGAIGAYNYGSGYNITIDSCRFNYNTNLCYAYTNISTTSVGRGGAISVLNGGYLTVYNSNFTGNYAKIGQAIAAATYNYENGTGGNPHIKICNNRFVAHTATGIDTVVITGNDYLFNNNVFINSYQNTQYAGTGNTYNAVGNMVNIYSKSKSMPKNLKSNSYAVLGSTNSELLSDGEIILYVNGSIESDELDGTSWENAIGAPFSIYIAPDLLFDYGATKGIIYIAKGDYSMDRLILASSFNITFIGYDEDVLLPDVLSAISSSTVNNTYTFINLTFKKYDFGISANFINCTFIDSDLSVNKYINDQLVKKTLDERHIEEDGYAKTFLTNFDNCVFKDTFTDGALINLYKYGAVNFNNCTFENITADSLVYHNNTGYYEEDGISFKNCTFTNCKYNGIVDSLANFDDAVVIEDCTYDGKVAVGTTEVDGHYYINATKLNVVAVATNVNISSSERGVVVITVRDAEGNPVSGVNVNYTVNGENMTGVSDANGTVTVSGLTNEIIVGAAFEGNENYLASNNTASFNFTIPKVATKLSATGLTTYYNVGKYVVATLKDANGKVLANQKVVIKLNCKTYTKVTNAKGQVTLKVTTLLPKTYTATINYAGDDTHIKSSATAKVVVKKATVKVSAKAKTFKKSLKTKKYSIVLKNNVGKVMKKTKVYLKIKGKTFKAYTNSKGVATFKITKLTKKGKYNAYIKYAGSKYYNSLTKKVRITLK